MATITLDSQLELKTTGAYSFPQRSTDFLPLVYGDLSENSGDQGIIACPKLSTVTHTHALAGHAIQTAANGNTFRFFDSDQNEISTSYTIAPSNNYESQGTIATVTFASNVGEVAGQYNGKPNDDGSLMVNPITIFEDIVGGTSALNRTSFTQAQQLSEFLGYTAAGAIVAENKYRVWLNNLAGSFLMDWFSSTDGEIKVRLDSSTGVSFQPAFFLTERETGKVKGRQAIDNLLNQPAVNYAISYAQTDRRFREGVSAFYLKSDDGSAYIDINSQRRYKKRTPPGGAFDFDWTRNDATVSVLQQRLVAKFKNPVWVIDWPEITAQAMQAEEGDFGIYSWQERIDSDGNAGTEIFCQLLTKQKSGRSPGLSFVLRDTGVKYSATVDTWNGSDATLGDGGTW